MADGAVVGEVFSPAKAFTAGRTPEPLQVDVLVLLQAVLTGELHTALTTLEQLQQVSLGPPKGYSTIVHACAVAVSARF